jgi:hypothetical protein
VAGLLISTFKAWRSENAPGLATIEAALGALGWALVPVPKPEMLDEELRAHVEKLAEEFASDDACIGAAIAAAAASTERNRAGLGHCNFAPGSLPAQRLAEAAEQ